MDGRVTHAPARLLQRHLLPFGVALAASTLVMLINQAAKRLPALLDQDLPGSVILEVFVLSVPFIMAMTLPMAVLVAVLWVFTRLSPSGDRPNLPSVLRPILAGAACVAFVSFIWNDQVVPRANHELRTLLTEIEISGSAPAPALVRGDREMTIAALTQVATSAREQATRAAAEGQAAVERGARLRAANYEVEIQKKYALAAASLFFVLIAVPAGLWLRRLGAAGVVGAALVVFTFYYVGLIAGEAFGNRLVVSPFLAMWAPNLIIGSFGLVGLGLMRTPRVPSTAPIQSA